MTPAPRLPTLVLAEDLWETPRDTDDLVVWVSWLDQHETEEAPFPPEEADRAA